MKGRKGCECKRGASSLKAQGWLWPAEGFRKANPEPCTTSLSGSCKRKCLHVQRGHAQVRSVALVPALASHPPSPHPTHPGAASHNPKSRSLEHALGVAAASAAASSHAQVAKPGVARMRLQLLTQGGGCLHTNHVVWYGKQYGEPCSDP